MARKSKKDFEDWIDEKSLPHSVEEYLLENGYDSTTALNFLTAEVIDNFDLSSNEKNLLKIALQIADIKENITVTEPLADTEHQNITVTEPLADTEHLRWKEFGLARSFSKWKKDFLPVELFSPDGFWAWNSAAKSLTYGKEKSLDIWNKFDDKEPGWIMSPPVLLPSQVGSFKLTFNLRVYKNQSDDSPMLNICLVNDSYNKRISETSNFPVNFQLTLKFINLTKGLAIGIPLNVPCCFEKLFDSKNLPIPGNVLILKKPPIILFEAGLK